MSVVLVRPDSRPRTRGQDMIKRMSIITGLLAGILLSVPAWSRGGGYRNSVPQPSHSSDSGPPHPDVDPPNEEADTTYRFVGARFRYIVIPQFYMGLFGSGGTTVGVPAFQTGRRKARGSAAVRINSYFVNLS